MVPACSGRDRDSAHLRDGTRDSLAPRAELTRSARKVNGPVTLHWLESADHGYRPLKASGLTPASVNAEVAETCVTWILSLMGPEGST